MHGRGRNPAAVDEHAHHLGPVAQPLGDDLGDSLVVGERRAGRQLDRKQRARLLILVWPRACVGEDGMLRKKARRPRSQILAAKLPV